MKIRWKTLLLCLAIPLAAGGFSAWLTRGSMAQFSQLDQPPLSPPGWLFPVVWTLLYLLMGLASYLVFTSNTPAREREQALRLYGLQLLVNFCWPLLFFGLSRYLLAFFWLVLLWVLVLRTLIFFRRISPPAGRLLVPYLLWVTFAGYLNLGIALLN